MNEELAQLLAMTEVDLDAELRKIGIDPNTASQMAGAAIESAFSRAADYVCGMCGNTVAHTHTPEEIVIFKNGVKRGLASGSGARTNGYQKGTAVTDKLPIDDSVTAEYLAWLESNHPMHGLGGNVAWNAGVAFGKSQAVREAVPEGFVLVSKEILDRFPEINTSNYDHDDACNLNAWGVELVLSIAAAKEAK